MLADILSDVIPSADSSILDTAFAVARSSNDERLLVALASRTDLPSEMEEYLSSVPSVKVQRARFSRPGMDAETIRRALKKEKRAGVLSAIASTEGLPEEIYKSLSASSFRAVAAAVLANTSASFESRTTAGRKLAERFESLPYATQRSLTGAIEARDVDLAAVFESADSALKSLMAKYASSLPEQHQLTLASMVLERAQKVSADKSRNGHGSYRWHAAVKEISHIACVLVDSTDSDSVVAVVGAADPLLGDPALSALLSSRINGISARRDRMVLAQESNDTSELAALVSEVLANKDAKIARILAENTSVPIDAAASMLGLLNQQEIVAAAIDRNCPATAGRMVPNLSAEHLTHLTRHFGHEIVKYLPSNRLCGAEILDNDDLSIHAREFVLSCSLGRIRQILSPRYGTCPISVKDAVAEILATLPPQSTEVVLNLSSDWTGTLGDLVSLGVVLDDKH